MSKLIKRIPPIFEEFVDGFGSSIISGMFRIECFRRPNAEVTESIGCLIMRPETILLLENAIKQTKDIYEKKFGKLNKYNKHVHKLLRTSRSRQGDIT